MSRNARHVHSAAAMQLVLCLILGSADAAAQSPPPRRSPALERLAEAVELIRRDYVDPVDDGKLAAGCREGMLGEFDPSKRPQLAQAGSPQSPSVTDQFLDLVGSITKQDPQAAGEAKLAGACLRGALKALDPVSAYIDEAEYRDLLQVGGPLGGLGMELKLDAGFPIVVAPIESGPAERAGLRPGDIVVAIDAASTEKQTLSEVVKRLRGLVGSGITLTIVRKGSPQPLTYALTREVIRVRSVRWKTVVPGYAYIRITQFQEATGPLLAQAIEAAYRENADELRGLILDLRNNPGGLLNACVAVAAAFLPSGALVASTAGRSEDSKMRLTASPENYIRSRSQPDYFEKLLPGVKTVPMVVLVNGLTASGSELVATALRDHKRARILGARTFDLGTVATILPMPGNTALKLTTARLIGPNGKPVAPVIPDVLLEKSDTPAAAYGSADDGQLFQAVKILAGQPVPDRR